MIKHLLHHDHYNYYNRYHYYYYYYLFPNFYIYYLAIPFPKHFNQSVKVIYTRLFRIFAIIYSHHFLPLEELGAVTHLNTSFKHFMFFVWEYDLVVKAEQEALQDIIYELKARYTSNEYN